MSELQIGLLVIGALVVAGVLVYNGIQERGAKRAAERTFRSGHADVLMGAAASASGGDGGGEASREAPQEAPRHPERGTAATAAAQPDPKVDYIVELSLEQPALQPVAQAALKEQWSAIERRHARRALLADSPDGRTWRAALQLVSRDGAVGEADLIEFRSAVETLAAAMGASVSAPEMRAAVETARALDEFCAETDIQVVVHVRAPRYAPPPRRAAWRWRRTASSPCATTITGCCTRSARMMARPFPPPRCARRRRKRSPWRWTSRARPTRGARSNP
jgi:hypothetical protein